MKINKFNETIKLSDDLISVFKSINSDITKKIISLNGSESEIEDIRINPNNAELIDFSTINNKGRFTPIRTGRLIRRILDENQVAYVQADIEKLINDYKSELNDSNIRIVTGKDILKGYSKSEYYDIGDFDKYCSLYRSCMTDELSFLKLYTDNKCCSLVILENNSKIEARAILWDGEVDGKKRKFMDRVYSINDSYEQKLKNWAFKNDYLVVRNKTGDDDVLNKLIDKNGNLYSTAIVELDKYEFDKYPYVDTLVYQYENKITNDKRKVPSNIISYQLRTTNGQRTIYNIITEGCVFEQVSGDDIKQWFKFDNYEQRYGFHYTLNRKSYEDSDLEFLSKYSTLLIYITPERKLLARAIILNGNIKVCTETDSMSSAIDDLIIEKVHELGAATFEYGEVDGRYPDGYYKIGDEKFDNFEIKIDREYPNYMLSSVYLNKTKLLITNKLTPIDGDFIYYVDYGYTYAQFKEVWKTPKGPTIPSYDNNGSIVKSDFDNKYYFKEDVVYAKLSSSLSRTITTHRDNCINLSENGSSYVYKYDTAFNITDFALDETKTKWLMWCISSKVPENFKDYDSGSNRTYGDKILRYDVVNYREVSLGLSHVKSKEIRKQIYGKSTDSATTFEMNFIIKIRPTNVQFRIEDKKGGLIYYINARSFKDFINNKSYELFKDLDNFCNRIN